MNISRNNNLYKEFEKFFLEQNNVLNLISKNDEKYLYEKHFYDSLSIKYFFDKYNFSPKTLLDIGTGGGFPSVPIALFYPSIHVTAVDSINKKINAVNNIKNNMDIKNLNSICCRVENLVDKKFDIIVSRAVGKIQLLIEYSYLLNDNGYFVFYKSKKTGEELNDVKNILKKYDLKYFDKIDYKLPNLPEYERNLVILQKII